jgi:hypothetical protein
MRLKTRNGAKAKVTLGGATKAQVAVPTQGSVGISRSFTQTSPSRSKPRRASGILIGKKPNFNVKENTMRELPVYRNPTWYLKTQIIPRQTIDMILNKFKHLNTILFQDQWQTKKT